nr:hypothetical protein [Leptospira alstonii]
MGLTNFTIGSKESIFKGSVRDIFFLIFFLAENPLFDFFFFNLFLVEVVFFFDIGAFETFFFIFFFILSLSERFIDVFI